MTLGELLAAIPPATKDFIPGTDTYESAKTAGKLLGATTGGGEFKAAKVGHYSQVDGAPENTKGLYNQPFFAYFARSSFTTC